MKIFLVRGIPGAGKSTLVEDLNVDLRIAADDYHMVNGEYKWVAANVKAGHDWCKKSVENAMKHALKIAVHNTFTTDAELAPYIELAKQYKYQLTSIVVENRHGNESIHNVPEETIQKMKDRFVVKL